MASVQAALNDAELDRSPSTNVELSDGSALSGKLSHLNKCLDEEYSEQSGSDSEDDDSQDQIGQDCGDPHDKAQVLELVGRSQLYSSWLAEQCKDIVEEILAANAATYHNEEEKDQPPAKRRKTKAAAGRGQKDTAPPSATQVLLPLMKAELRDYQLRGVVWMISLYKNGVSGILADEMGLGKTIQTIGFISYLWMHCKGGSGKCLVVGPLSTLGNWEAEFHRFCPDIPVLVYHGAPEQRAAMRLEHMGEGNGKQMPVIITSYDVAMMDRRHLERHTWKLLVVDEGHRLKNYNCKLLKELRSLKTGSRLLLTGTPLQNNLRELWSLLSFCMPQVFNDVDKFLDWFDIHTVDTATASGIPFMPTASFSASVTAAGGAGVGGAQAGAKQRRGRKKAAAADDKKATVQSGGAAAAGVEPQPAAECKMDSGAGNAASSAAAAGVGASSSSDGGSGVGNGGREEQQDKSQQQLATATMVSRLHAILKPFVLRRVKTDVNIGIPPKQEVVLYAEMTEVQKKLTLALANRSLEEELAKEGGSLRNFSLNNLLMQMRKVCNHPDLITGRASGTLEYPSPSELVAQCGKLALLERLLKHLRAGGHRVLIFSQMTEMLNVIESYLQNLGIGSLRIDGSVDLQTRKQEIAEFQNPSSDKWVFLLSTRAGGLGINLTAADTVIIYDSDWNPHQDSQAMDRCHRIGQTKPVLVFRLVTANSVENRMLAKADSKKALERVVIKKGAFKELLQSKTSSTSAEELMKLMNLDRRDQGLAQSGVVSEDMLKKLLDRTHLAAAAAVSSGPTQAGGSRDKARKGACASKVATIAMGTAVTAPESGGKVAIPPYPLVGVGYEVVLEDAHGGTGLLQAIDGR
ncbi:hypothetical protein Vafri_12312 [Volvox africanus]|uniref:Uncharacterized protein n=1 Tax=Volvox africanus TaxID=51714 RepID=A0A8J4F2K0_9CHLO|nr:hypothetical protein Vafri_12312 [Volvox africanus]